MDNFYVFMTELWNYNSNTKKYFREDTNLRKQFKIY